MLPFKTINDEMTDGHVRYVSFTGDDRRFDLAIVKSEQEQAKSFVIDLQRSRYTEIHDDELEDSDYFCHFLHLNTYEAEAIHDYLTELLQQPQAT
ncbi:SAV0927 family protein [Alkalibacillus almallahensis]|uniref:SAV0927 family protein n=1 Tax=Alkalibacillus almallahensis TaxID=1379154 RepID=UPI0014201B1B|nr:SAV0927 family protein [Alkalibacillus almallahensis]NIK12183.1 hypothetical protein [Alkalibacillus almallahensis]